MLGSEVNVDKAEPSRSRSFWMKIMRRTTDHLQNEETTIVSPGVELNGMIKGNGNIILHGALEGNVEGSGTIHLEAFGAGLYGLPYHA